MPQVQINSSLAKNLLRVLRDEPVLHPADRYQMAVDLEAAIGKDPADGHHRRPYVGEGADGARRSAEIDRSEADTYDRVADADRIVACLESAARWEAQADQLEAQVNASMVAGDITNDHIGLPIFGVPGIEGWEQNLVLRDVDHSDGRVYLGFRWNDDPSPQNTLRGQFAAGQYLDPSAPVRVGPRRTTRWETPSDQMDAAGKITANPDLGPNSARYYR